MPVDADALEDDTALFQMTILVRLICGSRTRGEPGAPVARWRRRSYRRCRTTSLERCRPRGARLVEVGEQVGAVETRRETCPVAVPPGAISIDPPATPDSLSLVATTNRVGSLGLGGSKLIDGGASSMWTVMELVPVLGCPCGSIALFQAVQLTV